MKIDPTRKLSIAEASRAWSFARNVHAGQLRKPASAGIPYIRHISDVAALVSIYCTDEQAILVAILHDTIEESKSPDQAARQIAALFGEEVLERVRMLTNPFGVGVEAKKEHQLFCYYDAITALVKVCDKISNVRDILDLKPAWTVETKRAYVDHADTLISRLAGEGMVPPGLVLEWERDRQRAAEEIR